VKLLPLIIWSVLFVYFPDSLVAQSEPPVRLKRERGMVFFQQGVKKDSISKNKGDVFYLLVPDSLKELVSIAVDNGRLLPTANDSLVTLSYLPGISYESMYVKEERADRTAATTLKTLINGASTLDQNYVRIRILHRIKGEQLRSTYHYKE
jgi:hypothetical protein